MLGLEGSLRSKLHSYSVLLALTGLLVAGAGTHFLYSSAAGESAHVVSAIAPIVNSSLTTIVAAQQKNPAAIERSLVKSYGTGDAPFAVEVIGTSGAALASSSEAIPVIAPADWKSLLQKKGTVVVRSSCMAGELPALARPTTWLTNLLWNISDDDAFCTGSELRAVEAITVLGLTGGHSSRIVYPLSEIYVASAILTWGIVLALLSLLAYSWFVHRHVVHPLKKIKHGALIMAGGDLDHRIDVDNEDEIGIIANFVNEVGRNLKEVRAELIDRQRIASELDAAAKIQSHLLPQEIPYIPGLSIAARTRPSTEVGGDNYDFKHLDEENVLMFIGDVTGHGVPAGLVMIMIDVLIDTFSSMYKSPREILVNVNKFLTPNIDSTMYMTMVMLAFNIKQQTLRYASAGHEHIIHYHAKTKKCTVTRSGGIALGMIPDIEGIVQEHDLPLEVGDVIVLYSDGITEAFGGAGGKEMFGLDRFVAAIEKLGYRDAQAIFDGITKQLADFMGNTAQNDDITLFVLKYVGASMTDIEKAKNKVRISLNEGERKSKQRWDWEKKPTALAGK